MKQIRISTDCVADFPERIRKQAGISVMYYYIYTEKARFQDGFEMDSGALIDYIETHEDFPRSSCASEEEYKRYFQSLKAEGADSIIHISMGRYASNSFDVAGRAAAELEGVYVVDSGMLSSAIAVLALYAADLAGRGCPVPVLLDALEKKKEKLSSSFVVRDTEYIVKGGRLNARLGGMMERLKLHPFFMMESSRIRVKGFFWGKERRYAKMYINRVLRKPDTIDSSMLFITTAGCSDTFKEWLGTEAQKRVSWDRIIFQDASATISCNCGAGAFGFLFARK